MEQMTLGCLVEPVGKERLLHQAVEETRGAPAVVLVGKVVRLGYEDCLRVPADETEPLVG